MLVLARKVRERILVPSVNMIITVLKISGEVVRIGIEAPPDVLILREEVENVEQVSTLQNQLDELRNQLQIARVGLSLLAAMIDRGDDCSEIRKTICQIKSSFGPKSGVVSPTSNPISALVVDDDENERELMAKFLRMAGHEVATASSHEDALRKVG